MNTQYHPHFIPGTFRRYSVGLLLCLLFVTTGRAQVVIGGDVYGGGFEGAVGTAGQPSETSVQINGTATVRTVFGGGKNGRVYGNTEVTIQGGTIGAKKWEETPYGGVYGGGEGAGAVVSGSAQVTVHGGDNYNNVYGGGKQALLEGNSKVVLNRGTIRGSVYAGARMADINGYGMVDIVGDNTLSAPQLLVKAVYGGNDISGTIKNLSHGRPAFDFKVTTGLPSVLESYVVARSSATNTFIGNVYGGGNGAYEYGGAGDGNWSVTLNDPEALSGTTTFSNLPNKPVAARAYLQIEGGTYGSIYGGGNNATISERTDIYYGIGMNGDSYSDVTPLADIPVAALDWLDLYEGYTKNAGETAFAMKYNAFRIFGGNNLAAMDIRPTWHLKAGTVGNIYSGGNKGRMTYEKGLFLPLTSNHLKVNNVYGGCRMADVNPGGKNGVGGIANEIITYHRFKHADGPAFDESYSATYEFTEGFAARVLVLAGQINNLYGGNDISGKVYYGTNVELRGAISGDVYGGGNGSYAYTDKREWVDSYPQDADYYYDPGSNSLDSLYQKRPHVEKTLLHITGIDAAAPPVYVTGGVYCGGNSATLDKEGDQSLATAKFMIGQNVIINGVFLGSNGENMISNDILQKYGNPDFTDLRLTQSDQFEKYMKGVSVNLVPEIVWEWDDEDPNVVPGGYGQPGHKGIQSYIGSFYCGGNVGSMTTPRQMVMNFPRCLTVYDRVVGGCNAANITASTYNAAHGGGVTNERTNGLEREPGVPKVVLNVHSRLEPRELVATFDSNGFITGTPVFNIDKASYTYGGNDYSILNGANIYAGCYQSGYINGDVAINITRDLVSPEIPAADMQLDNQAFLDDAGEDTAMPFAYYVFSNAMNVYGGGYGENTEIRGTSTINLDNEARVMKVFGGGERGAVLHGATVNLMSTLKKPQDGGFNAYMVYGGGYEGVIGRFGVDPIMANTRVLLHGGRLFDAYGGSCNADINGATYVEIGDGNSNHLQVMNSVYGANDFGGKLGMSQLWTTDDAKPIRSFTHVKYRSGAVENEVYAGSYGSYDYSKFTEDEQSGFSFPKQDMTLSPQPGDPVGTNAYNTFVQVASQSVSGDDYVKGAIYGGGRGYADATGIVDVKKSYVRLMGSQARIPNLSPTVFGGGYYSKVEETLVDALSGRFGTLYGGTAGMNAADFTNHAISYNVDHTCVKLYEGMRNPNMNIFGAGPLAGADTTQVWLYGGMANNVYGGSYAQGICGITNVTIPEEATVTVNALYGGSMGVNNHLPCDVFEANIRVASDKAYVSDTIFGGNHAYRAVKRTNIDITAPVLTAEDGVLVNVYAGGNGARTITGSTHVTLHENAMLMDVYGGGKSGTVVDDYDGALAAAVQTYYAQHDYPQWTAADYPFNTHVNLLGGELRNVYAGGYAGDVLGATYLKIGAPVAAATHDNGCPTIRRSAYGGGEMALVSDSAVVEMYNGYVGYVYDEKTHTYKKDLDFRKEGDKLLKENGNLYGAGYGEGAVVMSSRVRLYGGTIRNGLYGGGEIAAVGKGTVKFENEKYVLDEFIEGGSTQVRMYGGLVEGDVFGGGRGFSYDLTGNLVTGKIKYTDGYVFGKTDVEIYRGTIGTETSLAEGHGNVFGGGNIGYVYGGSTSGPSVQYTGDTIGTKITGHYYIDNTYAERSEDCRVHITAQCVALEDITLNGHAYAAGSQVPTAELNTLLATDSIWTKLDSVGITIQNAVFAGGNVSAGSDKIYANAVTVYGNATAAVIDVFSKDFVSLGGDGVGGLYGDGNLTFVDGYRELNITNYGTDYYNMSEMLSYEEYLKLSDREKGFYNLLYTAKERVDFQFDDVRYKYDPVNGEIPADEIDEHAYKTMMNAYIALQSGHMATKWEWSEGNCTAKVGMAFLVGSTEYAYAAGTTLNAHEYDEMMGNFKTAVRDSMAAKWDVNGECPLTAGRMMNTIQRADFCGMFGSRIMLYGAQDRVPDIVDYTKYTINRVGEVSLNRLTIDDIEHGNYFGIYNVVNFLGALTSDVEFTSLRQAEGCEPGLEADGITSYLKFKEKRLNESSRNMGSSQNMVAQASGVFLELVKDKDDKGNKIYGPVTGVIQLDLINVQPGEGGGYVYARNEHGKPQEVDDDVKDHQILSDANEGAISYANFTYMEDTDSLKLYQTSGNFVHPIKRIVDECFPYVGYHIPTESPYSTAHLWYIRGNFYVYDQYVSAYTGSAQAYMQDIEIPLTITAGSEGRMKLISVNPNKYAYFEGKHYGETVLTAEDSIQIEDETYTLNEPISYWKWSQLSVTDQAYFVDSTYVSICTAIIDGQEYQKGSVMLPKDYRNLNPVAAILDENGHQHAVRTDSVFRISNEISHDAGYLLTFDISNPLEWGDYYTKHIKGSELEMVRDSIYKTFSDAEKALYKPAPTLLCTKKGIYGQRYYEEDDLVNQAVITGHKTISESTIPAVQTAYNAIKGEQAKFDPVHVVTAEELSFTVGATDYHMFEGSYISDSLYQKLDPSLKTLAYFDSAYICINTIEVADKEYLLNGELISKTRYDEMVASTANATNYFMYGKDMTRFFSKAFVCIREGKFGGAYFEEQKNYIALDYCGLTADDRNAKNDNGEEVFQFNYDAFDLLSTDFDEDINLYGERYSKTQPVNYTATYEGSATTIKMREGTDTTYVGTLADRMINDGTVFQRADYESILNEKAHYMPVKVTKLDSTYHIVNDVFEKSNIYYPIGKVISDEDYFMLNAQQQTNITSVAGSTFPTTGTYYYCTETYKLSTEEGSKVTSLAGGAYVTTGTAVPKGILINQTEFNGLPNYQTGFAIHGHSPIQTTTIYVPRESDVLNLSKNRVITVVYKYDYKEGDGANITSNSEKHIINIHVEFRSGQPTIGDVTPPSTVLPNSTVGLSVPSVTKGAYEILGGGWEIFETPEDAYEHRNGVAYKNNATPMYWYQNGYYIAYFAKTYLGKTYSNPVPFSIANYHRMGEVMNHEQRMFIDHKDVDRASKIYLDNADYATGSIAYDKGNKNDLDYMYDLYKETVDGSTAGGYTFNPRVEDAANLEFILRSDIAPAEYTDWKQPGDVAEHCFAGNFHGNGHTVTQLDKSLFHALCGTVYNTGVTGSFAGGGVADLNGTAINSWVKTSGTPAASTYAVIGNAASGAADVRVINSYYDAANGFAEGGMATPRTERDFVNGHVAYDLNRFYLEARRGDPGHSGAEFRFYVRQADGTLEKDGAVPAVFASRYHADNTLDMGYVEEYITSGDFIYAAGVVPWENDIRYQQETEFHYPIYPDDYLFFGQSLDYTATHDVTPTALVKDENGFVVHEDLGGLTANRVYRAPAFRMSSDLGAATPAVYFNRYAAFAGKYGTKAIDHDLTAIDFTGNPAKETPAVKTAVVYTPLLDYEGLNSFVASDITKNLLVYADAENDATSHSILEASLPEPAYTFNESGSYYEVKKAATNSVMGHLVDLRNGAFESSRNHFLVDKQSFNAPMAYTFQYDDETKDGFMMWYQRTPERFVDGDGGWEGICLPFTAKFVAAHEKGEITHFYGDATGNLSNDKAHEYWLRAPSEVTASAGKTSMVFTRPVKNDDSRYAVGDYSAWNSFLYDFYYSNTNGDDDNGDSYVDASLEESKNENQQQGFIADNHGNYYSGTERLYEDYVYLSANVPYLIGMPGANYYEFDMSGTYYPAHADGVFDNLEEQTISYVSEKGIEIGVTDQQPVTTEKGGYTYSGSFMNKEVTGSYVLNAAGDAFEAATTVQPFRTYVTKVSAGVAPKRIYIGHGIEDGNSPEEEIALGNLKIYGKDGAIHIESTLEVETLVTIHTVGGIKLKQLYVLPGAHVKVPVANRGIYIVNRKKVTVY